jgi:cell division protein FtsW
MNSKAHADKTLFFTIMALLLISVIMVYSSSSVVALTNYNDPAYFVKRQILWLVIGLALMAITMHTDHHALANRRAVVGLLIISLLLLAATLVPSVGREINGARRWLRFGSLTFQPSELAKFAMVVYLSYYLSKKGERIRDLANGLIPACVVTALFLGVTTLQPDFGAAMMLAGVMVIMVFAAGANVLHLGALAAGSLPLVYFAVAGTAYRSRRIFAFLDPWSDPSGSGHQIIQSFLAFGSGGLFGRGLGEGRQKLLFLPERHSDFIYAVIGEELGLLGGLVVVLLFCMILWRGIRISLTVGDRFSSLLALGITLFICLQGFINMAVVTGILPTKGTVLPFVSYGGSSLVIMMAAAGVLLNISKEAGS